MLGAFIGCVDDDEELFRRLTPVPEPARACAKVTHVPFVFCPSIAVGIDADEIRRVWAGRTGDTSSREVRRPVLELLEHFAFDFC